VYVSSTKNQTSKKQHSYYMKQPLFLFLLSLCLTAAGQPPSTVQRRLDSLFSTVFKPGEPGGAVLVARKGQVLFKKGYGVEDINTRKPITAKTLFNTGSISKTFVSYGILRLEQEGKLSLNDPIAKYFPDFNSKTIAQKVTLQNLMTHSSGLPDARKVSANPVFYLTAKDPENWAPIKSVETLNFEPSSKFEYSNPAFNGLAIVIEQVTSQPWQRYLRRTIFQPSGMPRSTITDGPHPRKGVSHGYERRPDGTFSELDYGEEPTFAASGNGGVWSSVEELWAYEQAIQKAVFLKPEHITRSRTIAPQSNWADTKPPFMGLSWFILRDDRMGAQIGHTGSQGGFISDYIWLPEQGIFYVLLCNTPVALAKIRQGVFGILEQDFPNMRR
jgi:CubicO group peptidase (beta-lactamase class C family)